MMLLIYIIKMTLISGLLYCYYWFFLRNKRFHQYNRFYLLGIPCIAALLPLLKVPIPFAGLGNNGNAIKLLGVSEGEWETPVTIVAHKNFFSVFLNWQYLSWFLYILVSVILLFLLIRSLAYISGITRRYDGQFVNDIYFFQTDEPGTPFSFFRQIFWNKKLDIESAEGQQIFRHELYHVRQVHSADILFLEIMGIITWFNPFIHLVKKEMRAIHEFLADEYAISESNRYAYAELLVMQSLRNKQSNLLHPFFHNQIKRRITMITKFKNPKNNYLSKLMILPVLFILFCAFAAKYNHKSPLVHSNKTITVVIDAGHGGIDPGARVTGVDEKDLVLKISKKIQEVSKNYNVNVVMTREKDELPGNASTIHDGLKNRTEIAVRNNADLFISIHLNNGSNPSESGFQMYISDKDSKLLQKNLQLGSILSEEIKKDYPVDETLIRSNKSIAVLNNSKIPAIIVECGYLTNPKDLSFMTNEENQEKIAKDILEAVVRFQKDYGHLEKNQNPTTPSYTEEVVVLSNQADSVPSTSSKRKIYKKVEVEATFPGGQKAWQEYLSKTLHYPDTAVNAEIQGDVLMEFIVNKDGSISDVKAVSGPEVLKPESIRMIKQSGKWIPAMNNGQTVACYRKQPIKYRLEKQ